MHPLADVTTPHSLVASRNTLALADMTTPHSTMIASKSFQTFGERDQMLRHHENLPRKVRPYPPALDSNVPAAEENEIVFDEEGISTSEHEDSLFKDGGAWRIDHDDVEPSLEDQYENLRSRNKGGSKGSAQDKLKNLLRKANCTAGSEEMIFEKKVSEEKISPLTEVSVFDRNALLNNSSKRNDLELNRPNIGVLQHFKNARCDQYVQFNESKLRAILDLESSGQKERPNAKEPTAPCDNRHETRPEIPRKNVNVHKAKGVRSQLALFGQRTSCTAIPTVDSMKAQTPRAPQDNSKLQSFDLDAPKSDMKRPS